MPATPTFVLISDGDLKIRLYDGATFALLATLDDGVASAYKRAVYDQAHNRVYGLHASGVIPFWDATSFVQGAGANAPAGMTPASIAVSWASKKLFIGGGGGGHTGIQVLSTDTHAALADIALVDLEGHADTARYLYVDQDKNQLWANGNNHLAAGGDRLQGNGVTVYCIDAASGATLLKVYDFRFDTTIAICFDPVAGKAYFAGYDDSGASGAGDADGDGGFWDRGFLWVIDTVAHTSALIHPIPVNGSFAHGYGPSHNTNNFMIGPGRWKFAEFDHDHLHLLIGGMVFDAAGNLVHDLGASIGTPPQALAYDAGIIKARKDGPGNWKTVNPVSWAVTDTGVAGTGYGDLFPFAAPPPVPLDLVASTNEDYVDLSWSPSAGATSYAILRAGAPGGPYAQIATTTETSYRDQPVPLGEKLFYVVQAVN